ncbi:MAG: acyltransferase [Bacteroidales bacterium]|nr:acyltransferase [Bacteroidales bacterium]
MNIRDLIRRLYVKWLYIASNEARIKYLRKRGMKIGDDCLMNTLLFSEPYLVEIGNHVAIAGGTQFISHDGAIWCFRDEIKNGDIFGKIKIGNNVFIGNNCVILPNTTVGDNCIIGIGSIVRGQFPDDSVIIGNPAKVIYKTSIQRLMYRQNKGLLLTHNLSEREKIKVILKHFDSE